MSNVLQFPSPAASSDAEARASALDIRSSCIVEAPAGSGKTGLLVQRFLKLLADNTVEHPPEVLAITFTNKAAAELRDRILKELIAAHANAPLEADKAFHRETRAFAEAALARDATLGWSILQHPHTLNLRTIDSVCAEIANSLPLLSGSGGNLRPTTDADPLYRLAAQQTLFQLGGADTRLHAALRLVLLHRDANLANVETLLAQMLGQRDQWADFIPLGPEALDDETLDRDIRPRLEKTLETMVCATLTRAAKLMPPGMLHDLSTLAAQFGMNPGYKGADSPIAFCSNLHQPPEEVADHLDHWQALISLLLTEKGTWRSTFNSNHVFFEMDKTEKAALKRLIDTHKSDALCAALCDVRKLPPAKYPDDQWQVCKALFLVLRRALAELHLLFAERTECDFIEIALAARHALRAEDSAAGIDIALSAGGRLRHLLVDEMQDTSASQYELIHQLTRSWDGVTQTLFLVGDPKQSIYGFRHARVERFLRTVREGRLATLQLLPLRLTANFRSQATLVNEVNATFELIFPSVAEAAVVNNDQVPFVPATPTRKLSLASDGFVWHTAIFGEELLDAPTTGNPKRDHELQEAREIRRIIERWLSRPPAEKPLRIAILAGARSHLGTIVAELKREPSIRYKATDIDPLRDRQEVLDALALTRALLHPADRTAWLAVLRAPWCGLALADLLTLTGEGPDADPCALIPALIASRAHLLSAEGQRLLARAWNILHSALNTLGHAPIEVHVERTWRSLGADLPLTPAERTNVLRFLDVLRKLRVELGVIDLAALDHRLESLYAEPTSTDCSVELLTIHKSKGLEWDVVIVPSLERRGGSGATDLLNWLEVDSTSTEDSPVILAPIQSKGSDAGALNHWLRAAESAREDAERKRLFYVLSTRAREELHLFAACSRTNKGELATPIHGSLLKSVWPAASRIFEASQHQAPAPDSNLNTTLTRSLAIELDEVPLALAASEDPHATAPSEAPTLLHRLPLTFDPHARFATAEANRLPYTPAAALRQSPTFDRPEGSFAVRAFGNVVHRYLQLLADRLSINPDPQTLLAELPSWPPRLTASLRAEGLSPTSLDALAKRALTALQTSLTDPEGRWLLSPHATASSEQTLAALTGELRVDRTFLAGPTPLSTADTHRWIVDFKTTEQGSRSPESFAEQERAKYSTQLESYATALSTSPQPILLGLYYPLIPRLIHWPATLETGNSQLVTGP